ncbi:ABC transporter substrate-binding protein [Rhodococcus rhodochrous]|uniref:ABC transporter substrate-binding protein n=1 Tax=Rhodococcus TaxID=1827 RepID=UPI000750CF3F|nr:MULTISPECIES: ABC transporter substrate-binding protein [Rhodococcus]AYA25514.1 ABC transporter substrate-binding protein [Rhodococcus rhodochrous]MCD2096477.1 ABC transporter substrate-binding protein [Rhodococcus rhodochrous]MCD2121305.1 ABC transporter substrate-binding protein [Rhodococcus rhodochrous]MCQ4136882.1 ABC transporter substrate-binding protein [Rhodococcus rhodochrous]MDC3727006.1 ABC transporter substrate-binding protein [Rhodococcus sp. Rp3]
MRIHKRLRRIGVALAATAMLVGVTACGSDTDSGSSSGSATASDGEFPVTVSGKFGEATVESAPTRALPLSPQDADILLSLGVTPLALPVDAQNLAATGGTGVWPWEAEALGADVPPLLNMDGGATVIAEQIAALQPDIIVSTGFWGLEQNTYDQLAEQFPVVHFDYRANGEPWQDSTRKIAAALGIPEKAEEVIEQAEVDLDAAKEQYPALEGATYNAIIGDTGGQLSVLAADDRGIGQFLNSLGLELSEYASTLQVDADGRGVLSYEEISQLDADLLVVVSPTGDLGYLTKFEAWNRLPAVERGAVVSLARNTGMPNAVGFPSALSLKWATDEIAPMLADAAAKSE